MVTGWWNFGFRVWGFGTSFYEFHKGAFKRLVRAFGGFLSLRFLGLFQDFVNFSGLYCVQVSSKGTCEPFKVRLCSRILSVSGQDEGLGSDTVLVL